MLHTSVVTQMADFDRLRDEWFDLLGRSKTATIFDSFEWQFAWWTAIGRKQAGARLTLSVFRDDNGLLVGIAPLYSKIRWPLPFRQLSFIGSGSSDYHDIIAADGFDSDVRSAFLNWLAVELRWSFADLNQLRERGILRMCSGEAGLARLSLLDLAQEECPYVDLPSDKSDGDRWELFLSEYSKKMRSNVRYYDRALDKIYEVDRRIASTPEEVDETFKSLLVLHQRRWNQRWLPGAFFAKSTQEFHSAVAPKLLERNWLRLHYLTLDGTTEAVLYCFSFNGVTSYYQGGFEPSLAKLSLGTVITGLAIRQALTDGNKTFDFLRGDEPYKRRWTKGSSAWNHRWILARRGTLLFSLIAVIIRFELRVEQGFKQWMHHRKKTPDTSAVAKLET